MALIKKHTSTHTHTQMVHRQGCTKPSQWEIYQGTL